MPIARRCPHSQPAAFTLLETVFALAMIAVTSVALLGLYPVGLRQVEASILETQGAQLARELFVSLWKGPYTAAECFGTIVDLTSLPDKPEPLIFYASERNRISSTPQADTRYRLRLDLRSAREPSGVEARQAVLTISTLSNAGGRVRYQALIVRPPHS